MSRTHLARDKRQHRSVNPSLDDVRTTLWKAPRFGLLDRHARKTSRAGAKERRNEERVDVFLASGGVRLSKGSAERWPAMLEGAEADR